MVYNLFPLVTVRIESLSDGDLKSTMGSIELWIKKRLYQVSAMCFLVFLQLLTFMASCPFNIPQLSIDDILSDISLISWIVSNLILYSLSKLIGSICLPVFTERNVSASF